MRAFSDVFGFELRLHLKSPLFWGVALLVGTLHLLTITEVGINVSDNDQIGINSAWLIFQTELILGLFGMLPALLFPVTSITRDDERKTTELFFTTPVPRLAFLLGRWAAGTCAACGTPLRGDERSRRSSRSSASTCWYSGANAAAASRPAMLAPMTMAVCCAMTGVADFMR